jgi:hypothetical protein
MDRKTLKDDLRKALHKAISKAYSEGNQTVKKAVEGIKAQHIVADILDPDFKAQKPHLHNIASASSVMNKDAASNPKMPIDGPSKADLHEQKEMSAKATLGTQEPKPLKKFLEMRKNKTTS